MGCRLPNIQVQPVLLQRQPVIGHALQIPQHFPVHHRQRTQGRIIIILAFAGIGFRDVGIPGAHIAAAVDGQGRAGDLGGQLLRFRQGLVPGVDGFADLPARILHPNGGQVALAAVHLAGFHGVFQGFGIIGKIFFPLRHRIAFLPQRGHRKQQQQHQRDPFFHFPASPLRRISEINIPQKPGALKPRALGTAVFTMSDPAFQTGLPTAGRQTPWPPGKRPAPPRCRSPAP